MSTRIGSMTATEDLGKQLPRKRDNRSYIKQLKSEWVEERKQRQFFPAVLIDHETQRKS